MTKEEIRTLATEVFDRDFANLILSWIPACTPELVFGAPFLSALLIQMGACEEKVPSHVASQFYEAYISINDRRQPVGAMPPH